MTYDGFCTCLCHITGSNCKCNALSVIPSSHKDVGKLPIGSRDLGVKSTMRSIKHPALSLLACLFVVVLSVPPVTAQSSQPDSVHLNSNVPMTYIVQKGDTLWDISGIYLKEPWRWPMLWDSNPQIDNPHLIYPGDVLELSWQAGRPRLRLVSRGDVKLSPSLRSEALDAAIPPIPRDEIDPFLRANRVLEPGDFEKLPYLIAGDAQRLLSSLGDKVYGRGPIDAVDRTYGVARKGSPIVDPVSGEMLGVNIGDIGNASLLASVDAEFLDAEVKEFEVTRITEEVRIGDRLIPVEEGILDAYFQPKSPDADIKDGFMVAVDGGVTQIGQMDIVTINRGKREGLGVGDVLAIYQTGEVVIDPIAGDAVSLPDARAGVLMIFAAYEKASYGLVLSASRPLSVGDKVKNP